MTISLTNTLSLSKRLENAFLKHIDIIFLIHFITRLSMQEQQLYVFLSL